MMPDAKQEAERFAVAWRLSGRLVPEPIAESMVGFITDIQARTLRAAAEAMQNHEVCDNHCGHATCCTTRRNKQLLTRLSDQIEDRA